MRVESLSLCHAGTNNPAKNNWSGLVNGFRAENALVIIIRNVPSLISEEDFEGMREKLKKQMDPKHPDDSIRYYVLCRNCAG